jgi:DNA-binding CsgD family transcriptional regulator
LVEETSSQKNISITSNELSDREKTILKHVAKGQTNKEIAENLYLSTHTVITHRKNITAKLGIKTISGLTVYAILNNLVTLEEIKE